MKDSPLKKENKLQMMSDFAEVRFQLKNAKLYQSRQVKKITTYSRFSKSKNKVEYQYASPAQPKNLKESKLESERQSEERSKMQQNETIKINVTSEKKQSDEGKAENEEVFSLKYLEKLSNNHILIGNEYQLDMMSIATVDNVIQPECRWSICPSDTISSLSIHPKSSFIAVSVGNNIDILKYNLRRQFQCPSVVLKQSQAQPIQFVRFVKNLSIFVVLQTKINFYRINLICEKTELELKFVHQIDNYGPNFKLYHVPQTIDNTLILYFYENRVKASERSKFGLWTQLIETSSLSDTPKIGKLTLNYLIKVQQRKQVSIYNYSKDISLLKFRYNIIAVKNGFVIDQTNVNFKSANSFIDYAESINKVIHFRETFIDVYQLKMNLKTKPESIVLECIDSISFEIPKQGKLFKVLELQTDKFALFYEKPTKMKMRGQPSLDYFFCVTQQTNIRTKIDLFYPKKEELEELDIDKIKQACGEATKIGMNNKEAYHQLWKRSNQTSSRDYQILISTEDFGTIQREVQRKLKSKSMPIRDIINLYSETLQMLKSHVISSKCTINNVIEYSACQFSLKKFEMLRFLKHLEKKSQINGSQDNTDNQEALLINIKDYYQISDMSIQREMIELLNSYLQKKSQKTVRKIKSLLTYFKLNFSLNYKEILTKIVQTTKYKIIQILKVIPDLLPYAETEEKNFWSPLTQEEKSSNLFLYDLLTIDNRDKLKEFPEHLWFKKNININHGVILTKRDEIDDYLNANLKQEDIFYKFICIIYNFKTFDDQFRSVIQYLYDNYPLLPQHLKGKLELYILLYQLFQNFNQAFEFEDFLKLKENSLFKCYFSREKVEKSGFILKKIMPIYSKVIKDGDSVFNQGLYNYFSSGESTVADLKCILNKINNEKKEFHLKSSNMYQVLINAIMEKIKIGSQEDTPMDQILVYIENIPFPINNDSIMSNLEFIQEINYEQETLRKIKINLTLREIVDNPKMIIKKMVQFEVDRHQIHKIKDYRTLKVLTYKILSEVQCRKTNIYGDVQRSFALKVYLVYIMRTKQMIKLCSNILKDKYLVSQYSIYTDFIEEVVIEVYNWRLNTEDQGENYFMKHIDYLVELTNLLEKDNLKRKYIQYSIKYAQLLTFQSGYKIEYPLFSENKEYPTLNDFTETINCLSPKQLTKIDHKMMFSVILKLKKIKESDLELSQQMKNYQQKLRIEIYQCLIVRLIEEKQLQYALKLIFDLLSIHHTYCQYDIVFPCLLIQKLAEQLLQNSINLFIKIISYYYDSPLELTKIIQQLMSRPFSNKEIDAFFEEKIKRREKKLIINTNNPILNQNLKISGGQNPIEVNKIMETCLQRIIHRNENYVKKYQMHIMYRLMCHNPIVVSKWILCKKRNINVKILRAFISFMALELPFEHNAIFDSGIEIFQIVSFKYTHNLFFSEIIRWRQKMTFQEMTQYAVQNRVQTEKFPMKLMSQCIEILKKKKEDLHLEENEIVINIKCHQDIKLLITKPQDYLEKPLSQYIYTDRDDGYENISDQLYIPSKKRLILKQKTQQKQSLNSENALLKKQELLQSQQNTRTRKYSEYFPEMLDIQRLGIDPSLKISQPLYTPKERKKFNFEFEIPEDHNENLPSLVKIPSKEENKQQNAIFNFENNLSPVVIIDQDQSQLLENSELDKKSESESVNVKSEVEQPDNSGFLINITQNNTNVPVQKVAKDLYLSVANQNGQYDFTQLEIQEKKPNFQSYLFLLLSHIYQDSLVNFYKRITLVLRITDLYEEMFNKECITIFQKLSKSKMLPNLSFKMVETVPIELIFSSNLEDAFKLFLQKNIQKIDSLNIYQAILYITQLFGHENFKDRFLLEFIRKIIKTRRQEERTQQIIMSLFNLFSDLTGSIEKYCREQEREGQKEENTINRKIKQLFSMYTLAKG